MRPSQEAFDAVCVAQLAFSNSATAFCRTLLDIKDNFGDNKFRIARDVYKKRYAAYLESQKRTDAVAQQPWKEISRKLANFVHCKCHPKFPNVPLALPLLHVYVQITSRSSCVSRISLQAMLQSWESQVTTREPSAKNFWLRGKKPVQLRHQHPQKFTSVAKSGYALQTHRLPVLHRVEVAM